MGPRAGPAGNAVLGNRIFGNGLRGCDLAADGVTANDVDDVDPGSNGAQNAPVLSVACLAADGAVVVGGTLSGSANATFRVEYFASAGADPSGHGEGQYFLGKATVTTDASGTGSFAAVLTLDGAPGAVIIAATAVACGNTAAAPAFGDTSEFSNAVGAA